MSEATPLPDEQPPAQPPEQLEAEASPAAPSRAVFDMDALEMGDLEDMEEYAGQPILPLVRQMYVTLDETEGDLFAAVATLPLKAISALLGVARRQQDPSFTQDKWRTAKFADVFPRRVEEPVEPVPSGPATPTPISGKRRGTASSSSKRSSGKRSGSGG